MPTAVFLYLQIMYAIRTRSGTVYLKIKRNFGDMSMLQVSTFSWTGATRGQATLACWCWLMQ